MGLLKARILSFVLFAVFYGSAAVFAWHHLIEAEADRIRRAFGNIIERLFHVPLTGSFDIFCYGWALLFFISAMGALYWLFRLITFRRDTDYIQGLVNWYERRCESGWRDN